MAQSTIHTSDEMSNWYESRRLERNFPQLIPFLSHGADVLDVGCGPGTITLDIAAHIHPGTVTGIDREPKLLQRAEDKARVEGVGKTYYDALFSQGVLSVADLDRAMSEIESWHTNPEAFMSVTYFLAVGTA